MKWFLLVIFTLLSSNVFAAKSSCREAMGAFFKYDAQMSTLKKQASSYNIELYGLKDTPENRLKFEKIYVRCMSPGPKEVEDVMSKKLNNTFNAISVGTMVTGYAYSNWDKPKDAEWFLNLGIGLAFGAVAGSLQDKLLKDTKNKYYNLIQDYLYGRGTDVVYMGVQSGIDQFTSIEKEKFKAYLNKLENQEDVERIRKMLENDYWYDNLRKKIFTALGYLDEVNIGAGKKYGIDFDHLTKEQLQDEDVQKVVLAALVSQEMERRKHAIIKTGNSNYDSFIFDSFYSILKIPKDILVNKMTMQMICLNMHNQSRGFTQAVGLNILNQVLFADYFGVTYRILKYEMVGDDENAIEKTKSNKVK